MIPLSNGTVAQITAEDAADDGAQPMLRASPKQERLEYLRAWRAANRGRLREKGRNWKVAHPDRVRLHRQREFAQRRRRRRRLRLRRAAQRRRRAQKRQVILKTLIP